jgi:hypothetical protein
LSNPAEEGQVPVIDAIQVVDDALRADPGRAQIRKSQPRIPPGLDLRPPLRVERIEDAADDLEDHEQGERGDQAEDHHLGP